MPDFPATTKLSKNEPLHDNKFCNTYGSNKVESSSNSRSKSRKNIGKLALPFDID